jgi:hypothetical protein
VEALLQAGFTADQAEQAVTAGTLNLDYLDRYYLEPAPPSGPGRCAARSIRPPTCQELLLIGPNRVEGSGAETQQFVHLGQDRARGHGPSSSWWTPSGPPGSLQRTAWDSEPPARGRPGPASRARSCSATSRRVTPSPIMMRQAGASRNSGRQPPPGGLTEVIVEESGAGADRQHILQFMTTEHFTLQTARGVANAEISSRLQR